MPTPIYYFTISGLSPTLRIDYGTAFGRSLFCVHMLSGWSGSLALSGFGCIPGID